MNIVLSVLVAFLLALVFILFKSKKKQIALNKNQQELSNELLKKATDLENANSRLKDKNEEIAQQKEEIVAQAESLQDSLKKLKELDEFKEGMTAMIVHDLKNPLSVIFNATEEPMVLDSGRKMLNMVNNILDVYRFESTKMPVRRKEFNLHSLSEEAAEKIIFPLNQKKITLINHLDPGRHVIADDDLIERVFINLLTNATKYTPVNGKIQLHESLNSNGTVKVFVSDNGPGIPEKLKNRVFDKFMQIIAKKSGDTRSFGLGLTFCKLAVEAHGGIIGVDTEVGKGTSFWFTLSTNENNDKVQKKEKEAIYSNSFSDTLKKKMQPYITELKGFDVYETSQIELIVTKIQKQETKGIASWVKALENAVYSVNQQEYNTLLNQMK